MYELIVDKNPRKKLYKLAKKDRSQAEIVSKAIKKILENPHSAKPLKQPMAGQRRVHVGSFVLTYEVDEPSKTVKILDYDHHDKVYKR